MILTPGGSKRGLSYWLKALECPCAHFMKYHENEYVPTFPEPAQHKDDISPPFVGTIFHALMGTSYWGGVIPPLHLEDMRLVQDVYPLEYAEADRLLLAYCAEYTLDKPSPTMLHYELDLVATAEQCEFYNVPALTGRADMIVAWEGGVLPGSGVYCPPGEYLWDFKTSGKSSKILDKQHRMQMMLYQDLYAKPLQGAIIDAVVSTKTVQLSRVVLPVVSDNDRKNIAETLMLAYMMQNLGATKNAASCVLKYGVCEYYARCW